jgi:bifunctional non-homologous end joining protein LigD
MSKPVPAAQSAVAVTHPEKVLWPDDGITKGDLVGYYRAVAGTVLAHLRGRPLVLKPFPRGVNAPAYYRQSLPRTAPEWLPRYHYTARADGGVNDMAMADSEDALIWLANQAAIELHPWLSRTDAPQQPDFVVFDLDILRAELFERALEVALLLRDALAEMGLRGYPKTTGGDGMHVYVPLDRGPDFARTRAFANAVAVRLERERPRLIATVSAMVGREEKVLVDYAQNALGKTTVAAYSVRPRPGATVSTPLAWDEVEAGRVRPGDFTIRTVPERLARRGDLFAPVLAGGQSLPSNAESAGAKR